MLNVTDPDSVDALMSGIREDLGDPLVLINNAGITQDNILMRMKRTSGSRLSTRTSRRLPTEQGLSAWHDQSPMGVHY